MLICLFHSRRHFQRRYISRKTNEKLIVQDTMVRWWRTHFFQYMRNDSVHFSNRRSFLEEWKLEFGVGQVRQALFKLWEYFYRN